MFPFELTPGKKLHKIGTLSFHHGCQSPSLKQHIRLFVCIQNDIFTMMCSFFLFFFSSRQHSKLKLNYFLVLLLSFEGPTIPPRISLKIGIFKISCIYFTYWLIYNYSITPHFKLQVHRYKQATYCC